MRDKDTLSNRHSRMEILKLHCDTDEVSICEDQWKLLGDILVGYSGSDLSTLATAAMMIPVRRMQVNIRWKYLKTVNDRRNGNIPLNKVYIVH